MENSKQNFWPTQYKYKIYTKFLKTVWKKNAKYLINFLYWLHVEMLMFCVSV